MTDYDILRNYRDQPWVTPPGQLGPVTGVEKSNGKKSWFLADNAVAYSRISGHSKLLDDQSNLIDWAACQAAVGLLVSDSARSEVYSLMNEFDGDPWNKGGKQRIKNAVANARTAAGSETASSAGTNFHKLSEISDEGGTPKFMSPEMASFLRQYREAIEAVHLEMLRTELFVVQDRLQLAGSLDRIVRLPFGATMIRKSMETGKDEEVDIGGKVVVADLKTGKSDPQYPLGPTVQISAYSHSVVYDQKTGIRTPIHEDLDPDVGLLIHFPIMTPKPEVKFYPLDLRFGWGAALAAGEVKRVRKIRPLKEMGEA